MTHIGIKIVAGGFQNLIRYRDECEKQSLERHLSMRAVSQLQSDRASWQPQVVSLTCRKPGGSRRGRKMASKIAARVEKPSDMLPQRLESTMSALDALLPSPCPESATPAQEEIILPEASSSQSEAETRSAGELSTSELSVPEPNLSNWRELDKAVLLNFAMTKAISWVKDQVKPTSIIEEDEYLPRAQARFAYALLLANIIVYAVGLSRLITDGPEGPSNYFYSLAEVNEAVEAGEYYRIVTANFLHDSFVHLAVSSYALLTIAPEAEAVLGSFTFLTTYIMGGVAGTAVCFLLTDTLTVGASSGIFGLIGAMGAFLYKNHKAPKSSDGLLYAVGALAFNLFLGQDHSSAVDNLGHLGGLVCGIYLGTLLSPMVVETPVKSETSPTDGPQIASSAGNRDMDKTPPAKDVKVVQPNRLQSLIILGCVTITLASSVAATVIHRVGHLPQPVWP